MSEHTTPRPTSDGARSTRRPARALQHPARALHRPARPARAVGVVGVVVAALTLAGCGGSGDPAPTPTPTPTSGGGPLESLLQDYLGDWSSEQVNAQLVRVEEMKAACMAEQGFEYTPIDYAAMGLDLVGEGLDAEWGSAQFAQEYGYGLADSPLTGDADQAEDPNTAYVAAMSPSEQDAYYTALYGQDYATLSTDPETAATTSWEELGCTGSAQHEFLGGGADGTDGTTSDDSGFEALQQELTTMMAGADADPRLNQVDSDWTACMADAGYPGLAGVGDAEAALTEELTTLQQAAYAGATDPATGEVDLAAAQTAIDAQLVDFRTREISTAVADATCRSEVGYDEVRADVDAEYQATFLAEHSAELQQWLESLNNLRDEG